MRLEHHLVGGYVRYISPLYYIIIIINAITSSSSLYRILSRTYMMYTMNAARINNYDRLRAIQIWLIYKLDLKSYRLSKLIDLKTYMETSPALGNWEPFHQ